MLRRSFISLPRYYSEKQWPNKLCTIYDASKGGNDLAAWQMAITDFGLVYKDMSKRITLLSSKTWTTFCAPNMYFVIFHKKSARKCKIFCIFTVENM